MTTPLTALDLWNHCFEGVTFHNKTSGGIKQPPSVPIASMSEADNLHEDGWFMKYSSLTVSTAGTEADPWAVTIASEGDLNIAKDLPFDATNQAAYGITYPNNLITNYIAIAKFGTFVGGLTIVSPEEGPNKLIDRLDVLRATGQTHIVIDITNAVGATKRLSMYTTYVGDGGFYGTTGGSDLRFNQPAEAYLDDVAGGGGGGGGAGGDGGGGAGGGAGGDPYVTTFNGETYKMADFTGFSRMLQGTLENKPFILNTETTLLTKKELTDLVIFRNEHLSKEIIEDNRFDKFPAYFSKLHASWGDESVTIDLKDFKVTHSTQNKEYETVNDMDKEYTWSTHEIKHGKMFITFGPVTLVVKNVPNLDVRNGFTVLGYNKIQNMVGALVKPMYVKDIKLKSLTSTKLINDVKERKPKRVVKEQFCTKEGEKQIRNVQIF